MVTHFDATVHAGTDAMKDLNQGDHEGFHEKTDRVLEELRLVAQARDRIARLRRREQSRQAGD